MFGVLLQPWPRDNTIVTLSWWPFLHLSELSLLMRVAGFADLRALEIRYCCIYVKSRTGLGLINCFYCVSRVLFLYTVCENVFISLDYYNGFNLWRKKKKAKEKAQKDQINCNTPESVVFFLIYFIEICRFTIKAISGHFTKLISIEFNPVGIQFNPTDLLIQSS